MTLQSSGAISLNQIAAEFGGSAPHSMSEYFKGGDNVPSTLTSSATQAAPSTNGTYNDFGSVTGLTNVRTSSLSAGSFVKVGSSSVNTSGTILTLNSATNAAGNPTRLARVRNESTGPQPVINRLESAFGGPPTVTTDEPDNVSIASGSVSSNFSVPENSTRGFRVRFHGAGSASNQIASVEFQSVVTTVTHTFTNNTGNDVIIEGTTIANTQSQAVTASGDYDITFTISVNANIPTSGKVAMTDFYGGRKT